MTAKNDIRVPELTDTPTCLSDCRDYVRSVIDSNAESVVQLGRVYVDQSALSDETLADRIHGYVRAALSELTAHISKIPKGFDHGLAVTGFLSDTVLSSPQLLRDNLFEGNLAERSYAALSRHLRDVAGQRINELLNDHEPRLNTATLTFEECVTHAKKLIHRAHRDHHRNEEEAKRPFAEACGPEACANNVIAELEIGRDESVSVLRSYPDLWRDTPARISSTIGLGIRDVIEARLVQIAKDEILACEPAEASSSQAETPESPSP